MKSFLHFPTLKKKKKLSSMIIKCLLILLNDKISSSENHGQCLSLKLWMEN